MWGDHPSPSGAHRVVAEAAAHEGIVDEAAVHSSSLRASGLSPPMAGAGNAASAQKWIDECAASDECSVAPAHEGIVEDAAVHSSSLRSSGFAPPLAGAGNAASAVAPSAAPTYAASTVLDEASIHSSSLVSTGFAPTVSRAAAAGAGGKPLLYINATCPFAHKAWLALLEKDVDFVTKFESLSDKSAAMCNTYKLAAPDPGAPAKVPIFVHNGAVMIESALVARYVAGTFDGGNDILPRTAAEEYAAALFAETFNAVTPNFFKALRAQSAEEVAAALDALRAGLKASDRALVLAGGAGPFVLEARYSLAEVVTSTMVGHVTYCPPRHPTHIVPWIIELHGAHPMTWRAISAKPYTMVPRISVVLAHYRG
jgi:glutathione S-transferase